MLLNLQTVTHQTTKPVQFGKFYIHKAIPSEETRTALREMSENASDYAELARCEGRNIHFRIEAFDKDNLGGPMDSFIRLTAVNDKNRITPALDQWVVADTEDHDAMKRDILDFANHCAES